MAKAAQEPFLNGSSSVYVEEMYRSWLKDPGSVHKVCVQHEFMFILKLYSIINSRGMPSSNRLQQA